MEESHRLPQILSPCSTSGRRGRNCDTITSPEFEFRIVHNPSFPQPNLLSADELFSGGFLLPLHVLQQPPPPQHNEVAEPDKTPESETSTTEPVLNKSKRWRHIFKKNEQSKDVSAREKKTGLGAGKVASAAELNISIWPFSRSRSAGNGGARPRAAAATRKVSSAPCSRSNSTGHESKSRNRAGVHLGRNSPVWQLRRGGGGEKGAKRDGNEGRRKMTAPKGRGRALSLNVPMCIGIGIGIGYRSNLSCSCRHEYDESGCGGVGGSEIEEVIRSRGSLSLFNIRSLFTKRIH